MTHSVEKPGKPLYHLSVGFCRILRTTWDLLSCIGSPAWVIKYQNFEVLRQSLKKHEVTECHWGVTMSHHECRLRRVTKCKITSFKRSFSHSEAGPTWLESFNWHPSQTKNCRLALFDFFLKYPSLIVFHFYYFTRYVVLNWYQDFAIFLHSFSHSKTK